jgi:hypothetical protein
MVEKERLEWQEYILLIKLLSKKLNFTPKSILAIGRGGFIPAVMLSHQFNIRPSVVLAKSYIKDKREEIIVSNIISLPGEEMVPPVLVVDDISDSGYTLMAMDKILKDLGMKHRRSYFFATIFYKPWSKIEPDFYAKKTEKWIVFPYERDFDQF